jgi:hypothetical protein
MVDRSDMETVVTPTCSWTESSSVCPQVIECCRATDRFGQPYPGKAVEHQQSAGCYDPDRSQNFVERRERQPSESACNTRRATSAGVTETTDGSSQASGRVTSRFKISFEPRPDADATAITMGDQALACEYAKLGDSPRLQSSVSLCVGSPC